MQTAKLEELNLKIKNLEAQNHGLKQTFDSAIKAALNQGKLKIENLEAQNRCLQQNFESAINAASNQGRCVVCWEIRQDKYLNSGCFHGIYCRPCMYQIMTNGSCTCSLCRAPMYKPLGPIQGIF